MRRYSLLVEGLVRNLNAPRGLRLLGAVLLLAFLVATGTYLVYVTGGTKYVYLHILYVPVVIAAFLFGWPGGLAMALVAGLSLGPWMPIDVAANQPQPFFAWIYRTAFFALTGVIIGVLTSLLHTYLHTLERKTATLSETYASSLKTMIRYVDWRDKQIATHSECVAANAVFIGRTLDLEGSHQLSLLYWAGLLHDLGKIAVPDHILHKPGPLTDEEFAIMKSHPVVGTDILANLPGDLYPIIEGVRYHHERWDGTGYPEGLQREMIPLFGRILAVADVFEALTSSRPYRKAWLTTDAVSFVQKNAGIHFDPRVVEAFMTAYGQGDITVAGETPKTEAPRGWGTAFPIEGLELIENRA